MYRNDPFLTEKQNRLLKVILALPLLMAFFMTANLIAKCYSIYSAAKAEAVEKQAKWEAFKIAHHCTKSIDAKGFHDGWTRDEFECDDGNRYPIDYQTTWEIFSTKHDCKVVEVGRPGRYSQGTGYMCNDGIKYWRPLS